MKLLGPHSRWVLASALSGAAACALVACGQIKNRDESVVIVGEAAGQTAGTGGQSTGEILQQLGEVYDLYAGPDGLSRDELTNLMTRFGAGTNASIIDALFRFDRNLDQRITVSEIETGVNTSLDSLSWIPVSQDPVSETQLAENIAAAHPGASAGARRSLVRTLFALDSPAVGGSGDGRLSRKEFSLAALVMSGAEPAALAADPVLAMKLNQQAAVWSPSLAFAGLSADDQRLEARNFGVRFILAEKLTRRATISIEAAELSAQLGALRIAGSGPWDQQSLTRYAFRYDGALMVGNGDGNLNSVELVNLVTDLEFAVVMARRVADFGAIGRMRPQLLGAFPKAGADLFFDPSTGNPREKYWKAGLKEFDQGFGSDRDGRLSAVELGTAFYAARLLDGIFDRLDADHNLQLNHAEGFELLKAIGITDRDSVDYLFAEPPLDLSESRSTLALRMHTPGRRVLPAMGPWQTYSRLRRFLVR